MMRGLFIEPCAKPVFSKKFVMYTIHDHKVGKDGRSSQGPIHAALGAFLG